MSLFMAVFRWRCMLVFAGAGYEGIGDTGHVSRNGGTGLPEQQSGSLMCFLLAFRKQWRSITDE